MAVLTDAALAELARQVPGDEGRKAAALQALEDAAAGIRPPSPVLLTTAEGVALLQVYGDRYGTTPLRSALASMPEVTLPPEGASVMSLVNAARSSSQMLDVVRAYGTKLTTTQAHQLAKETLGNMGLPTSLPFALPKELSAEAVADAAYATGKRYADNALQAATGLPIKLPTKLTAAELKRTVLGAIPTDVSEAIDLGLTIGAQYAASAITAAASSALVGASLGSVVPGLGTVVGLGVALAVGLLKDELKDALSEAPQPFERACTSKVNCPAMPTNRSAIQLLPWATTVRKPITQVIANEQKRQYCGRGQAIECNAYLRVLEKRTYAIAEASVDVLGLGQVTALRRVYEAAPADHYRYDAGTVQRGGAVTGGTRTVITEPNREAIDILTKLRARQIWLTDLHARAVKAGQATAASLPALRWDLKTEIVNGAVQLQLDPSEDSRQWLSILAEDWKRYEAREAAELVALKRMYDAAPLRDCKVLWTPDGTACEVCEDGPVPACAAAAGYVRNPYKITLNLDLGKLCHVLWVRWRTDHPEDAGAFPLAGDPYFVKLCYEMSEQKITAAERERLWSDYVAARVLRQASPFALFMRQLFRPTSALG